MRKARLNLVIVDTFFFNNIDHPIKLISQSRSSSLPSRPGAIEAKSQGELASSLGFLLVYLDIMKTVDWFR